VVLEAPGVADAEESLVREEMSSVLILNGKRGVVHRTLSSSLDLPPTELITACGWKYGLCTDITFPSPDQVPSTHKALCGRCLPRWRAVVKRRGFGFRVGEAPSVLERAPPREQEA